MNKERAINILLEHAKRSTDRDSTYTIDSDALTAAILDSDALTAAILFLENERDKNKVDAKVEVTGVAFNIRKGA
jgi:hypothetical protein